MALLGIDIGDQSCVVGAAIGGGIEIITNDVTERLTPALVSFRAQDRKIGSSAKTQTIVNYTNTLFGIKNLLGRDIADPIVQHEIARLPFTVGQYPNSDQVGISVKYLGNDKWFTPTQIYSMLLRHIAENAEKTLNAKILSTVISVPAHFTDNQRRAVSDAASLAGVPCQRLINDGNAIALAYGIYKKDFPEDGLPPRNVAFVDFGYTSFQVTIFAFSHGKANCLSSVSCPNLGGRDFDKRLFDHFSAQFNQKYKVNMMDAKKSCLKLFTECEKLKKLMSANLTSIPMNIECLMGDNDFTTRMNRSEFELLCDDLLVRIEAALKEALIQSKIDLNELFSVELVGGSCRLPAVCRIVQKVFGKEVSKTLNFDESVAKGCAIQSALLSPTILVRQFHVVGVVPYSIRINWTDSDTGENGEMIAFRAGSPSNVSKVLSFYRKSDFQIECSYKEVDKTFHSNPLIAVFTIKNVKPSNEGQTSKVKVKFRVDNSGILTLPNVELIENKLVEIQEEVKEQIQPTIRDKKGKCHKGPQDAESENVMDNNLSQVPNTFLDNTMKMSEGATFEPTSSETLQKDSSYETSSLKRFKEVIGSTVLPVVTKARNMTQPEFEQAVEAEGKLIYQDRYQAEKVYSKNELEEYVYDMRDKLQHSLCEYYTQDERTSLQADLEQMDEWLINDDTQEEPSVYKEHLKRLRLQGDLGNMRCREFQERPSAFNMLGQSLVRYRKFVTDYNIGIGEYQHLGADEVVKVERVVNDWQSWLEEQLQVHQNLSKFINPQITAAEIIVMDKKLSEISLPIMSKPKRKLKEEPPMDVNCNQGIYRTSITDPNNPIPSQDPQPAQQEMDLC